MSFTEYTVADLRIKVMSNPLYHSAEFLRNSSKAVKFYTGEYQIEKCCQL